MNLQGRPRAAVATQAQTSGREGSDTTVAPGRRPSRSRLWRRPKRGSRGGPSGSKQVKSFARLQKTVENYRVWLGLRAGPGWVALPKIDPWRVEMGKVTGEKAMGETARANAMRGWRPNGLMQRLAELDAEAGLAAPAAPVGLHATAAVHLVRARPLGQCWYWWCCPLCPAFDGSDGRRRPEPARGPCERLAGSPPPDRLGHADCSQRGTNLLSVAGYRS